MRTRTVATLVATSAALAAGFVLPGTANAAVAAPNTNCSLTVPADPTSAAGLATPYRLTATDAKAGPCDESNADQSAFVEAAVLDPATGAIGIYHPLVVNAGDKPYAPPVTPVLPRGAVVGVWFGFNGDTLTLTGRGAREAVNGLAGSQFGQFGYINAPAFFGAANGAIRAGKLKVPALGTAKDGLPCPTTRDFSVVDQDQSDNLATAYWNVGGTMSQTPVTGATKMTNGSDEGLLAKFIDPALGCTAWQAPSLDQPGTQTYALALNELSAAANQGDPAALVPTNDPMVLDGNGKPSTAKTDAYRRGVDQAALPAGATAQQYCADLQRIAPARQAKDAALLTASNSPQAGTDLLTFLKARYTASLGLLGCNVTPQQVQAAHQHRQWHRRFDG